MEFRGVAELQQAAERDPPSGWAPAVPTPLAGNKPEPVRSPSEGRGRGAGTRGPDSSFSSSAALMAAAFPPLPPSYAESRPGIASVFRRRGGSSFGAAPRPPPLREWKANPSA